MKKIQVKIPGHEYPIISHPGLLNAVDNHVKSLKPTAIAIITDRRVAKHYLSTVKNALSKLAPVHTKILPAGEKTKSMAQFSSLMDFMMSKRFDRKSVVVALGGGVIGDLAGFAAASYMRGVRLVQIPTTLLAQVDSSVGGKTGINHPKGKNMIGAFHQPDMVLVDPKTLNTLTEPDFWSGMGEVVKYGVIWSPTLFRFLEKNVTTIKKRHLATMEHIILESCKIKAKVVAEDEKESGLRAILNYGHTFCHAFESISHYKGYLHGEAVSAGMVYACALAVQHGTVKPALYTRQMALLEALGMRTDYKETMTAKTINTLVKLMAKDKKSVGGTTRFILPTKMGHVELYDDVPAALVKSVLKARGRLV